MDVKCWDRLDSLVDSYLVGLLHNQAFGNPDDNEADVGPAAVPAADYYKYVELSGACVDSCPGSFSGPCSPFQQHQPLLRFALSSLDARDLSAFCVALVFVVGFG